MKKLLLFLLLVCFNVGSAQNLSLPQLVSLRTMDLDDAEMFLTQKGWDYKGVDNENGYTQVQFVYGSNGNFAMGESFINLTYSETGSQYFTIQLTRKSKYIEYLNLLKSFKPGLIQTKTIDGDLWKVYQGATTTFILIL